MTIKHLNTMPWKHMWRLRYTAMHFCFTPGKTASSIYCIGGFNTILLTRLMSSTGHNRYSESLWAGCSGEARRDFLHPSTQALDAHPPSWTMVTGYLPRGKAAGEWHRHPPPSSTEVREKIELYLYSASWDFMADCRVNFTFHTGRDMGWTVRGSNPGGSEIFRTLLHRP
jgi:hypothetical protein